jgi:peptide subunit release factor RF-3
MFLCITAAYNPAGPELRFPPIPSFSPELFAYLRCAPNQKKAFAKGVEGLLGEGAVQVHTIALYSGMLVDKTLDYM